MQRNSVVSLVVVLVLVVAAALVGRWGQAPDQELIAGLTQRIESLEQIPEPVVRDDPETVRDLERALSELVSRVERLETRPSRREIAPVEPEAKAVPEPDQADALASAAASGDEEAERAEFEALFASLSGAGWSNAWGGDDYERFLELARNSDYLDEHLARLEEHVENAPGDVEGRMQLADAYIAKLMTVAGPEQGIWGGRAEQQWNAVVELDDYNWKAHSSLGTNYSYYPEVMGKTPEAIEHLERARELQREQATEPGQVQTYLFLARLHQRDGNSDAARDVLLEGLERHPANADLEQALERLP